MSAVTGSLVRRLVTGDAVVIGLGSMIGAGVFAVPSTHSALVLPKVASFRPTKTHRTVRSAACVDGDFGTLFHAHGRDALRSSV